MYSLGKGNYVSIIGDQSLDVITRYLVENFEVILSPLTTFQELLDEKETHIEVGEFFDFYGTGADCLIFDKNTYELKTIRLRHSIKEKKPKNKKIADQAIVVKGNLKLEKRNKNYKSQNSFKYRYFNKKTNTILNYGKKFLKSTSISTKLEIAKDIFLLFNEKNNFVGGSYKIQSNILYKKHFIEKI